MQLVLSLFSGVGLLDRAFREKGFCVVSAGDLITGQDIRDFHVMAGKFDGVIGGSPCQDFSTLNRNRGDYSMEMVHEFVRVVEEAQPKWWLLENVLNVTGPGTKSVTQQERCKCGCKRLMTGCKKYYDAPCRKRGQRRREAS